MLRASVTRSSRPTRCYSAICTARIPRTPRWFADLSVVTPHDCDVVLRDGTTVRLRPLAASDAPALTGSYNSCRRTAFISGSSDAVLRHATSNACSWLTARASLRLSLNAAARSWPSRNTRATPIALRAPRPRFSSLTRCKDAESAHACSSCSLSTRVTMASRAFMRGCLGRTIECSRCSSIRASASGRRPNKVSSRSCSRWIRRRPLPRRSPSVRAWLPARRLRPFFEPASVAIVGADRDRGGVGAEILNNLRTTGFSGRILPIHPEVDRSCRAAPLIRG